MVRPGRICALAAVIALGGSDAAADSQPGGPRSLQPRRPTGRVAFHLNSWRYGQPDEPGTTMSETITTVSYRFDDREDDGLEFGVDMRHSGFTSGDRRARLSVYDGFVGVRLMDGALRVRGGHLWLNELGGLGAVAGALAEGGQRAGSTTAIGRVRGGLFGGLEPRLYRAGYEPRVRKYGGYVSVDGSGARRHVLGLVRVENGSLTERSALVATNYLPLGRRAFVYQSSEYDLHNPAGLARRGLTYFFANVRISPRDRVDLQATVSRGRSVDVRGLGQDVLAGRPVDARSVEGLRYQSTGGRATVEVFRGARAYLGYTRDTDNRGEDATDRWAAGAYMTNLGGSGMDVTVSDHIANRPGGRSHAYYVSVGRELARRAYLNVDYSTSLAIVRFLRSDGLLVETRPESRRLGSSALVTLGRSLSLLATADYTRDGAFRDLRVTTGLSYRLR